jgi:plastocyanin
MTSGHRGVVIVLAGLVLSTSACGGSSPGPAVSALTSSTTVSGAPASTAAAGPTGAGHCPANAGFISTVNDHGSVPVKGSQVAIEAGDFFFSPTCQTRAPASGTVMLVVHNAGQALHNVSVPDQDIDSDVQPGQTITVQVKVGTNPFTFFCKYHRTSGMVGPIIPAGS